MTKKILLILGIIVTTVLVYLAWKKYGPGCKKFKDNYFVSGDKNYIAFLMESADKPPFKEGDKIIVKQNEVDSEGKPITDLAKRQIGDGKTEVFKIFTVKQQDRDVWVVQTTMNRMGNTPVIGGCISKAGF